jgi:hypothetical protein
MAQMVLSYFCTRMNADEKAIIDYLKGWPHAFVSGREIARKVGGKARYEDDRGWAIPILAQMVRLGFIEADAYGSFRLAQEEKKKRRHVQQHVSPQVLRILKSSGKSFDGITIDHELADDESSG